MRASLNLAAITLGVLVAPASWGCLSREVPGPDADYQTIVLAEVVGVHLTDYGRARLEQIREGRPGPNTWQSDTSPGYEVDLIGFETFKGSIGQTMSLRVPGGCGIGTPELNQFGIFYVDERGEADVVLQDDPEYRDRLQKLGSRYADTCNTAVERLAPHPCWKPRQAFVGCLRHIETTGSYLETSCPSGVRDLYERMYLESVGSYGWKPPLRPNK